MNLPVKNCSSCMACVNVCARGAIEIVQDKEGFFRPQVNEDICSKCGKCEKACPWENIIENPNGSSISPKALAAYSNNENIRLHSSSGGIFSTLASSVLAQGGLIVGVGYKDPIHLEFKVIEKEEEMSLIRLSKYFQANPDFIYKQVKKLLLDGHKVLFSGTSCQVAALYSVLGKRQFENLTTIDIVCHGVPSQKVFEKFILESDNTCENIIFRSKKTGWKNYSMALNNKNGSKFISARPTSNTFMQAFLKDLCLNTSCAECKYRKIPRIADITLGDYWGISKHHPEMDDDKGTSVVLLNTEQGEKLFNEAQGRETSPAMTICESRLEYAIAGNPCIAHSSQPHKNRDAFMDNLDNATLSELLKKYNPPPSLLYRMARKIYRSLKKFLP
jgi:coenzyme F420-reducing hydrogenase beta subunit